jgi:RNA-directed DNA polymerase
MGELKALEKPFDLEMGRLGGVGESQANKGAPGVDGVSIAEFEKDLKNNLFKVWSASSQAGGEAVILCS